MDFKAMPYLLSMCLNCGYILYIQHSADYKQERYFILTNQQGIPQLRQVHSCFQCNLFFDTEQIAEAQSIVEVDDVVLCKKETL